MDAGRRGLPVDRLVRGGGAALLGRLLDRGFRRGELVACRCRIPCAIRRRGRADSLGERHTGVRLVQRQERPASTAPDSGGRTSRGRAAPGIRSRLVGQPDRTVPRPGMRTRHRPVVENRTDPAHRLALGADDAAVRVRRRHPLSGSRVQLGLEPMDRPGSAVYRILLIRADGHLSDRALHMAVESDVPDRSAQHRADGTVWCRAVGLPVFHRFQRRRIRGAVIRAVPVRRVLLRRHRQPVLQPAVAVAPRRH